MVLSSVFYGYNGPLCKTTLKASNSTLIVLEELILKKPLGLHTYVICALLILKLASPVTNSGSSFIGRLDWSVLMAKIITYDF